MARYDSWKAFRCQIIWRRFSVIATALLFAAYGFAGLQSRNSSAENVDPSAEGAGVQAFAQATVLASAALTITTSTLTSGSVNANYSQTLGASGGTPPYSNWSVASGTLPVGLTLSAAGVLSGTPTKAGASTFKVKVIDGAGASATSVSLQLTIAAAFTISTPATLTAGKVNVAYTQTLAATGGTPPYSGWTVSSGTLPPGLTLSASGALTGTPTLAGSYSFTVGVNDKAGNSASTAFQLTVAPGKLAISTASLLPSGQVNVVYSQSLAATGGTPPYTAWAVATGALPAGLTLSSALLGGAPTTAGAYSFTIQVTDSAGATTSTAFKLTINNLPLQIATPSPLAVGQANASYSQTLTAIGGAPPYANWSITSGSLPAGLTLSAAGILSGTPNNTGAYSFTVQVTDKAGAFASAAFQLTILQGALAISTASPLPTGRVNITYSQSLTATGGRPPYTWAANSGVPGLSFSPSGIWSGTPSTPGTFSFTVQVADGAGTTLSAPFQLTISPSTPVTITTTSLLPPGNVNTSYLQSLAATNGTPPYTNWTITSGSLPPGLTLSGAGVLSGLPTNTGTSSFTVQVTDSGGITASAPFQLNINAAKLAITTATPLPSGKVNNSYSQTMAASGGTPPFTWGTNSTVPGLTLSSGGVWSGTPTAAGAYNFTVQVTDSAAITASMMFQLTISAPGVSILTSSLPAAQIGATYLQTLTASGGTAPYVWSANSTPPGLSLNSAGVLSGTPTTAGISSITIQVTDSTGSSTSAPLQLTVSAGLLAITTSSPLSPGKVNTSYSASLAASGGTPPYANWTISNGTLPAGLTLGSTGILSGTPTTAGTYGFRIQVADKAGTTASTPFQLTIASSALTITTASPLPAGKLNTTFSQSLAASGGTPPYTNWTYSSGALPAGVSLSSAGILSGTPTTAGNFTFTIQVTDSAGAVASTPFQLSITPSTLAITTASPLPGGKVNAIYSQSLGASGGTPPYANWSISNGTLPAGLALSSTAVLSGTPTTAGTYNFTIQVSDSASASVSALFQLVISAGALAITTSSALPSGHMSTPYSQTLSASGGTPPYSWTTSSSAPGLSLSPAGVWSGTPTSVGTYSFAIQVTDSAGASASASLQLVIGQPSPTIAAAVSSASFVGGLPVTSGSWVALYGTNLAPVGDSRMWNSSIEIVNGKLPLSLDGTSVTVNGKPATVEYISPGQVNIQIPDDTALGSVPVVVTTTAGGASSPFTVSYAQFSPGFFPATGPYIVAQHADNSYVTATAPARPGEVIILWGAGMGPASPPIPAGQVFAGANPLANTVTVTIGGRSAALDFAGVVGAGLVQLNVHVPTGIDTGDQAVIATVGDVSSPSGAYIRVGAPASTTTSLKAPAEPSGANKMGVIGLQGIAPPTPIYAGTDSGIYKSSDAGATWQVSLPSPETLTFINSIVVDPLHPARVYAAGVNYSGGDTFFASLDAGQTWSKAVAPPAAALALDATATNVIYLLGARGGEVYRSDDSGRSWTRTPLADIVAITADPNVTGAVYALAKQNVLLRSYDFGMTWSSMAMNLKDETSSIGETSQIRVDARNTRSIFVASASVACDPGPTLALCGVFRSIDEGYIWQDLSLDSSWYAGSMPPFATYVVTNSNGGKTAAVATIFTDPRNSNNMYLLGTLPLNSGNSNGLFRSRNGGATWDSSLVLPGPGQVLSLGIAAQ